MRLSSRRLLVNSAVFFSLASVSASPALAQSSGASAPQAQRPTAAQPSNAGRKALTDYLDNIAAQELARRHDHMDHDVTNRAAALSRQAEVRAQILHLLGPLPQRTALNARTTGSTPMDGFRVDKVIFDSQLNFPITALLYLPVAPPGSSAHPEHFFPAIVMAPGHSPAGKAGDVAMASAFARAGFAVLSYDPIGQGERLQYPDPANPGRTLAKQPTGEHGEAGLQPTLSGDAIAQYFLWDGMRAVDYLQSLPEVDPNRIGAFGCSGGGAMTALLGALDPRIAAVGTACYITSFDTLLPALGPQDAEQSIPGFIAAGLDFPDWVELAAPRAYAIISTTEDMFPFTGAQATEKEARRFYGLLGADANLSFITGPGHHGNLRPITPQILAFFAEHLHPDAFYAKALPPITDPFALVAPGANPPRKPGERPSFPPPPPASLTQVTPTGQVSSSFPDAATVFSLNRDRAAKIATPHPKTLADLQRAIRDVTKAEVVAGPAPTNTAAPEPGPLPASLAAASPVPEHIRHRLILHMEPGIDLPAEFYRPSTPGKHPAILRLVPSLDPGLDSDSEAQRQDEIREAIASARQGTAVLLFTPRPSPPGTEETKAPILGPFYITELRAELVGRPLLGLRVDDVIRALNFLAFGYTVDPGSISGDSKDPHLGLVLLHAAVLDSRLKHIRAPGTLASYRFLVNEPVPKDAPQDILPGVLLHYDIPDLIRVLGSRAEFRQ